MKISIADLERRAGQNGGYVAALVRASADQAMVQHVLDQAAQPPTPSGQPCPAVTTLVDTPTGPCFLIPRWWGSGEQAQLESLQTTSWLQSLQTAMTDAGITGTITPAAQGRGRTVTWKLPTYRRLGVVAYYHATAEMYEEARHITVNAWPDNPAATQIVTGACALASTNVDQISYNLSRKGVRPVVTAADPGAHIASLTTYFSTGMFLEGTTINAPGVSTTVRFSRVHEMGISIYDSTLDWRGHVDQLRQALTWAPELTDVATLITCDGIATWSGAVPPEAIGAPLGPCLASLVPDIRGLQLVTDQHLARARDLTGWTVTPAGTDRYLLEADDLTPWYSGPQPDPTTLTTARNQFHDLLLTNRDRRP